MRRDIARVLTVLTRERSGRRLSAEIETMAENTRGIRKKRVGVVVSDKMDKTVTVGFRAWRRIHVFKKYIMRSKKYKAHDEDNECRVGRQGAHRGNAALSRDQVLEGQADPRARRVAPR